MQQNSIGMPTKQRHQSLIIANKDDEREDTFCYSLFENALFDKLRMDELVKYVLHNQLDLTEKEILNWIIQGVNRCFAYHKDVTDLYSILNYSTDLEEKWHSFWKIKLLGTLEK